MPNLNRPIQIMQHSVVMLSNVRLGLHKRRLNAEVYRNTAYLTKPVKKSIYSVHLQ